MKNQNTYANDNDAYDRKQWFITNNKLVIVRYCDEQMGSIIGAFQDDNGALEYLESFMKNEKKSLIALELIWVSFDGYLNRNKNINRNTFLHKLIKSATFRDPRGEKDSEICFWFQIIDNYIK